MPLNALRVERMGLPSAFTQDHYTFGFSLLLRHLGSIYRSDNQSMLVVSDLLHSSAGEAWFSKELTHTDGTAVDTVVCLALDHRLHSYSIVESIDLIDYHPAVTTIVLLLLFPFFQ